MMVASNCCISACDVEVLVRCSARATSASKRLPGPTGSVGCAFSRPKVQMSGL